MRDRLALRRPERSEGLARIAVSALIILLPLTLMLGFADNVETPKRIVGAGLALALAGATAWSAERRARLMAAPLTWPCLGLAAVTVGSALASGVPGVSWAGEEGSWMGAATLAPVLITAALAGAWMTRGLARRLAAGLAIAATLSVAYEAVQAAGLDPMPWNPRLKGDYWLFAGLGNPVHLANVLLAAFWASFALWPVASVPGWIMRAIWLAGAAVTGERSVLVGLAGGFVAAIISRPDVVRRAADHGQRGWAVGIGVLVAAALMAARGTRLLSGLRLFGARPAIWTGACRLLRGRPWLGIGPDMFYTRFPEIATYDFFIAEPPELVLNAVRVRLPGSAHNELFGMAAGLGLLGVGLYLWALVTAWRQGRGAWMFPAAVSLWCVHLVNPPCVTTLTLFWLLLVAGASGAPPMQGKQNRNGIDRLGIPVVACAIVILAAGFWSAVQNGIAQAHRREVGRLVYLGERTALAAHLTRWDAAAAAIHPRQAAEDAAHWRELGNMARAHELLQRARAANPENIFYASVVADLAPAGDAPGLAQAEAILRGLLVQAPTVLSLHDDLADVLLRAGRSAEAARCREERRRRDPLGLFTARTNQTRAAGGPSLPAQ